MLQVLLDAEALGEEVEVPITLPRAILRGEEVEVPITLPRAILVSEETVMKQLRGFTHHPLGASGTLAVFFGGGDLYGLPPKGRPIVVGNLFSRLVSKCDAAISVEDARSSCNCNWACQEEELRPGSMLCKLSMVHIWANR